MENIMSMVRFNPNYLLEKKLLPSFAILQRHSVGEPSEKFLLDLNLRETVFCLDFFTSPQNILFYHELFSLISSICWLFSCILMLYSAFGSDELNGNVQTRYYIVSVIFLRLCTPSGTSFFLAPRERLSDSKNVIFIFHIRIFQRCIAAVFKLYNNCGQTQVKH